METEKEVEAHQGVETQPFETEKEVETEKESEVLSSRRFGDFDDESTSSVDQDPGVGDEMSPRDPLDDSDRDHDARAADGGSGGGGSGDIGSRTTIGVADIAGGKDKPESLITIGDDDIARGDSDGGEEEEDMVQSELETESVGRKTDEIGHILDVDGGGGVRDGTIDHSTSRTGHPITSGGAAVGGFDIDDGSVVLEAPPREEEELTHEVEQEEQEQGRVETPPEGDEKKKKTVGKRAKGVLGVVAAAAYYAGWAVVTIALG